MSQQLYGKELIIMLLQWQIYGHFLKAFPSPLTHKDTICALLF